MKLWKVLGLAGLAGVAATGVIMAREQRQRTQLGPEEIRARLHERLERLDHAIPPTRDEAVAVVARSGPRTATRGRLRGCRPRWSGRTPARSGTRRPPGDPAQPPAEQPQA